jgi:hypothetical protein
MPSHTITPGTICNAINYKIQPTPIESLTFDESVEVNWEGIGTVNAPLNLQATGSSFANGQSLPSWANPAVSCTLSAAGNAPVTGPIYGELLGAQLKANVPTWLTYSCQARWKFVANTSGAVNVLSSAAANGLLLDIDVSLEATGPAGQVASALAQTAYTVYSLLNSRVVLAVEFNLGFSPNELNVPQAHINYLVTPNINVIAPAPKWTAVVWWVGQMVGSVAITSGMTTAGIYAFATCPESGGVGCVVGAGLFAGSVLVGSLLNQWAESEIADP